MQHRLNPLRQKSNTLVSSMVKFFIILSILGGIFYFVEKVNFPSPQTEIKKDVTDTIKRIK